MFLAPFEAIDQGLVELKPVKDGANNSVASFKYGAKQYFLKNYYPGKAGDKSRFDCEIHFYEFLHEVGSKQVPKLLKKDHLRDRALFEFISGSKLMGQVKWPEIQQCLDFFLEINCAKNKGIKLADAADTSRSPQQFVDNIEHRLKRFESAELNAELKNFTVKLRDKFNLLKSRIKLSAKILGDNNLCLSPSDFGFHNAIEKDGEFYFFDFEYAGWDDPVKFICDFFCQPQNPVDEKYLSRFTEGVSSAFPSYTEMKNYVDILMPFCRIKWCCIILNSFLQEEKERRKFAGKAGFDHFNGQLNKAKDYYKKHLE